MGAGVSKQTLVANLIAAKHRMRLHHEKRRNEIERGKTEIQQLISAKQFDRARLRAEGIVLAQRRIEAEEVLDLMCDLLKSRVESLLRAKSCPEDAKESVHTLIWAAPQTDLQELRVVREQLLMKFGEKFCAPALGSGERTAPPPPPSSSSMTTNNGGTTATSAAGTKKENGPGECYVNPDVHDRLSLKAPSAEAVAAVLVSIAAAGKIPFDPVKDLANSRIGLGGGSPAAPVPPLLPSATSSTGAGGKPSDGNGGGGGATSTGIPPGSTTIVISTAADGTQQVQVHGPDASSATTAPAAPLDPFTNRPYQPGNAFNPSIGMDGMNNNNMMMMQQQQGMGGGGGMFYPQQQQQDGGMMMMGYQQQPPAMAPLGPMGIPIAMPYPGAQPMGGMGMMMPHHMMMGGGNGVGDINNNNNFQQPKNGGGGGEMMLMNGGPTATPGYTFGGGTSPPPASSSSSQGVHDDPNFGNVTKPANNSGGGNTDTNTTSSSSSSSGAGAGNAAPAAAESEEANAEEFEKNTSALEARLAALRANRQ